MGVVGGQAGMSWRAAILEEGGWYNVGLFLGAEWAEDRCQYCRARARKVPEVIMKASLSM